MLTTHYSRSVQDFVKAVYVLSGRQRLVSNHALKTRLGTSAPAVSEMAQQLVARGLLRMLPYQGVILTAPGEQLARRLVRDHVLLERWLVELLGVAPADAHTEAERLEHALSERLAARLEQHLAALGCTGLVLPLLCDVGAAAYVDGWHTANTLPAARLSSLDAATESLVPS